MFHHNIKLIQNCIQTYQPSPELQNLASDPDYRIAWIYFYLQFLYHAVLEVQNTGQSMGLVALIQKIKSIPKSSGMYFTRCITSLDDFSSPDVFFQKLQHRPKVFAPVASRSYLYYYDCLYNQLPLPHVSEYIKNKSIEPIQIPCGYIRQRQNRCGNFAVTMACLMNHVHFQDAESLNTVAINCEDSKSCTLEDVASSLLQAKRYHDVQICLTQDILITNLHFDQTSDSFFRVYIVCLDETQCRWLTLVHTTTKPRLKHQSIKYDRNSLEGLIELVEKGLEKDTMKILQQERKWGIPVDTEERTREMLHTRIGFCGVHCETAAHTLNDRSLKKVNPTKAHFYLQIDSGTIVDPTWKQFLYKSFAQIPKALKELDEVNSVFVGSVADMHEAISFLMKRYGKSEQEISEIQMLWQ